MTEITYVADDGTQTTIDAKDGHSVMSTAISNDIDGIIGECGGSMMCATCHCYVDHAWVEAVGQREDGEDDMLDSATSEVKTTSRLSCQIKITPELNGLIVYLPENQA